MVEEGLIDEKEAILRVEPQSLDQLLHPTLDPDAPTHVPDARPAGLARRRVAARSCSPPTRRRPEPAKGENVILVRIETSPEDIHGMHAAQGILTAAAA